MWIQKLEKIALGLLISSQALLAAAVAVWRDARLSIGLQLLAVLILAVSVALIIFVTGYYGF